MKAEKNKFPFLRRRDLENSSEIWLTTTLHLARNLENFAFPSALASSGREKLKMRLMSQLTSNLENAEKYSADELGPLEKEFLYEHSLAQASFQQAGRGEGFVIQDHIFATINMRNHLQLQVSESKGAIEEAYQRLLDIEASFNSPFAFASRFGYLSSNINECGTGMVGRLFLHTPALIHTGMLGKMLESLQDQEVEASSLQGGLEDIAGDVIIIRNRCTIGLTEDDILEQLRTSALKVLVAEKRTRKEIADRADIKDRVARAYGLAIHSYQLETLEAWGAISFLKLGLSIGYVDGISHASLNELFFTCRRAHLVAEYGIEISQEELPRRRAEYLHGSLRNAHLTI